MAIRNIPLFFSLSNPQTTPRAPPDGRLNWWYDGVIISTTTTVKLQALDLVNQL